MKKKYSGMIVVGLLALFIGLILSVQIGTISGSDQGGLVPLAKLKSYEEELKRAREEKERALQELLELEDRVNKIETEKAQEDAFISGLVSDTEKYKMASGVLDVHGPGLIITVKDPVVTDEYQDDYSVITYNYELLLSLVNKLKEAGAEAISINEQRIVTFTEVSLAGNNININGMATAPPYIVKAIGNPGTMESAITIRSGIVETMRTKYNLTVDINQEEDLAIARYSGVVNFKYALPISAKEEEVPTEGAVDVSQEGQAAPDVQTEPDGGDADEIQE